MGARVLFTDDLGTPGGRIGPRPGARREPSDASETEVPEAVAPARAPLSNNRGRRVPAPMKEHLGLIGLAAIAAGIVLTVLGTLGGTGFIGAGDASWAYAGYVTGVAGAVLVAIDRRADAAALADAEEKRACRRALGSVPDDGYAVDLCAGEPEVLAWLTTARKADAEPYVLDMTAEASL